MRPASSREGRYPKLFTKSAVQVENYPSALPSKADLDDQAFGLESAGTTNVGQWQYSTKPDGMMRQGRKSPSSATRPPKKKLIPPPFASCILLLATPAREHASGALEREGTGAVSGCMWLRDPRPDARPSPTPGYRLPDNRVQRSGWLRWRIRLNPLGVLRKPFQVTAGNSVRGA